MAGANTVTQSSSYKTFNFGANGLVGWVYPKSWDVSASNYLVVKMLRTTTQKLWLHIYDSTSMWGKKPFKYQITAKDNVIDLNNMVNEDGEKIDPANINIVAFASEKSQKVYVVDIYLSDDGTTPTGIDALHDDAPASSDIYDLTGRKVTETKQGIYVVGGKKVTF
jgi:hypothetical protein